MQLSTDILDHLRSDVAKWKILEKGGDLPQFTPDKKANAEADAFIKSKITPQ